MSLVQQIRDALRDSEGMTVAQLADALSADAGAVSKACSQLKWKGEFISQRDGATVVYAPAMPGGESGSPTIPKKTKKTKSKQLDAAAPKAAAQRKRDFIAASESAEKTLKALQFSANTTDDALQVYVHSVVDVAIYAPLKSAADQARAALDAFVTQGTEVAR